MNLLRQALEIVLDLKAALSVVERLVLRLSAQVSDIYLGSRWRLANHFSAMSHVFKDLVYRFLFLVLWNITNASSS